MSDDKEKKVDKDWEGTEAERCQCWRCGRIIPRYEDEC